ncbi:hypothetical protein BK799_09115 [Rhodococcus sp. D-1]|nr:hypothetical protein BK799_09115 [Rhodococcus sp. D-1]
MQVVGSGFEVCAATGRVVEVGAADVVVRGVVAAIVAVVVSRDVVVGVACVVVVSAAAVSVSSLLKSMLLKIAMLATAAMMMPIAMS